MKKLIPISQMPLRARDWYILLVASMEQIIGAALSTIAGIIIPLILLLGAPHLNSFDQGLLGCAGLAGIAIGSMIIGKLMDTTGYLIWFRICPLIIAGGAACAFFSREPASLSMSLFMIGTGVGGGYSLDSGYISEIMPAKWEGFLVGLAKASCSLGFIGGAAVSWLILKEIPSAAIWPWLILFVGLLGVATFLMRICWYQSPRWLLAKGDHAAAQKAARDFFGPDAEVLPISFDGPDKPLSWLEMFKGKSRKKVILSGLTWACEGLGVYGFGVFLPILVMALGLQGGHAEGLQKILDSVKTTAFINIFIAIGFAFGLATLRRLNIFKLMGCSFFICAAALGLLLAAHEWDWPVWISFFCFVAFEIALNAGPHLITYIVPSKIYSIDERGAGTGIATMLGKVGAILGVFCMPLLLEAGGVTLVLAVSVIVQIIGGLITFIYGKELNLL